MTQLKGGLVRRLVITACIAIACLTGPSAWGQTAKPGPTAKKATTTAGKKAGTPDVKNAATTAKKPATVAASHKGATSPAAKKAKAKAPAARPPANRAVTGEVTLV